MVSLSGCYTHHSKHQVVTTSSGVPAGLQQTGLENTADFTREEIDQLKARRAQQGALQTIYFPYDNSVVNPKYTTLIEEDVSYLKNHPNARIRLEGNTDQRGSREYNIGLGWRRANHVAERFQLLGVNKDQVITVSYGKEKPVSLGHTPKDYALNRRVDIIFEKY